jgi:hypothetical protein
MRYNVASKFGFSNANRLAAFSCSGAEREQVNGPFGTDTDRSAQTFRRPQLGDLPETESRMMLLRPVELRYRLFFGDRWGFQTTIGQPAL